MANAPNFYIYFLFFEKIYHLYSTNVLSNDNTKNNDTEYKQQHFKFITTDQDWQDLFS
jgi:hypothetical protein